MIVHIKKFGDIQLEPVAVVAVELAEDIVSPVGTVDLV